MIDNNIIQSLGAGSGIDTQNLLKQLVSIERAAPQARIDKKREVTENRISDFGTLKSAISTLQEAAKALVDPESLFSKSASYTESSALVPSKLGTTAQTGTYSFSVAQIAQSHTLSFSGFATAKDAVGEGTLTFNFGEWSRDVNDVIDGAFSADAEHESFDITIDSTNNSLEGLRDAINAADKGVTASIIFDGSQYHLSIVSESGKNNQLEISVAEAGGTPTDTDDSGLSRFAFNTAKAGFETREAQSGKNAILSLNGIPIERSSNSIDDIVEGLTFDVLKPTALGEKVTINVSDDKDFAETKIREFVDAYNAFLDVVKPIFGITEKEDEDGKRIKVTGSLNSDGLAKSMLSQIKNVIAQAIPGLVDSSFTSLGSIGIRTEVGDGKLSISEKDFSAAIKDHFSDIQKLFAPNKYSTDDSVLINSFNTKTKAGNYDVVITQAPTRGFYTGGAFVGVGFPFDSSGDTYDFSVQVNGKNSATLTLPAATYNSADDLAAAIQSLINSDATVKEGGASVSVSFNSGTGGFDIYSKQYGASSVVSVLAASSAAATNLGLAVAAGTNGTTVAGTINGVAGFGSANVLLPAIGQDGEGMAMLIGEGATGASVHFSRGFGGELEALLGKFLESKGVVQARSTTLTDSLEILDNDEEKLERRMTAYQERLLRQFISMEQILGSLSTSGSFLDNLINTLPFTASKDK